MSKISYIDHNVLLAQAYLSRNYAEVRQAVLAQAKDENCHFITCEDEIFGYTIHKNVPLTQLYEFPCYVVKFLFSGADTLHQEKQESCMAELCHMLAADMDSQKGYYNLRVPTHLVDLLRAVNSSLPGLMLCGGTVEEVHVGTPSAPQLKDGLQLFFADEAFICANKERLISMAFDSFQSYQGQYHISPVTSDRAGRIYSNWIQSYFDHFCPQSVLVAQYEGEITGYCTIEERDNAIDATLSSVNEGSRRLGAYKAMISTLISYAKEKEKVFVTSTQFDNYIVQGTWNSLGLRPFYSIYNLHRDCR